MDLGVMNQLDEETRKALVLQLLGGGGGGVQTTFSSQQNSSGNPTGLALSLLQQQVQQQQQEQHRHQQQAQQAAQHELLLKQVLLGQQQEQPNAISVATRASFSQPRTTSLPTDAETLLRSAAASSSAASTNTALSSAASSVDLSRNLPAAASLLTPATATATAEQPTNLHSMNATSLHRNNRGNLSNNKSVAQNPAETNDDLSALPQLRGRVRAHMDEAIKSIPMEDKAAYLEALEKAPQVVQTETDPLLFVRRCDYDLWSAAQRLCLYWKERREVFGLERAFFPLNLTGQGALSEHDILTLHAGWPAVLPDAQTPNGERRKVVFYDRRKFIPSATVESKLRCIFYIFKVLSEQGLEKQTESASSDSALFLGLVAHTGRLYDMDFGWVQRAVTLANKVMPVKFDFVLLNVPNPNKPARVKDLMATATDYVNRICGSVKVHMESQPGDLLRVCQEELGMQMPGIPECIGGDWRFQMAYEWCKERARAERLDFSIANSSSALSGMDPAAAASTPHLDPIQTPFSASARDSKAASAVREGEASDNKKRKANMTKQELEEEKRAKRRLADLIQSRRKRERQRREFANLKQEAAQFQEDNVRLRAEHARLQNLLQRANQLTGSSSA